jgi:hypothetical protein
MASQADGVDSYHIPAGSVLQSWYNHLEMKWERKRDATGGRSHQDESLVGSPIQISETAST